MSQYTDTERLALNVAAAAATRDRKKLKLNAAKAAVELAEKDYRDAVDVFNTFRSEFSRATCHGQV